MESLKVAFNPRLLLRYGDTRQNFSEHNSRSTAFPARMSSLSGAVTASFLPRKKSTLTEVSTTMTGFLNGFRFL